LPYIGVMGASTPKNASNLRVIELLWDKSNEVLAILCELKNETSDNLESQLIL
jgi:hypothetical protein